MIPGSAIRRQIKRIWWRVQLRCRLFAGQLGVLPDFLIIGSQRCGTTSLYRYLCRHPSILPALRKEVHYFDLNFDQGVEWYRAQFPRLRRAANDDRDQSPDYVTGEASPYYLYHPQVPERVLDLIPQVKLIVLLRNPIDRAYSYYQHKVRTGVEKLSFAAALDKERDRLRGESEKLEEDPSYYSFSHNHFSYATGGIYVDQLERWLKFFARDQMLIINSEALFEDEASVIQGVLQFLDLPSHEVNTGTPFNVARYERMDDKVARELKEFFRPHNQRLYELLGTDYGWD